jgi:hypothetical protein
VKRVLPAAAQDLAEAENQGMTIDLTGPRPTVDSTCDHCGRLEQLYRLIGTAVPLCRDCFARKHG